MKTQIIVILHLIVLVAIVINLQSCFDDKGGEITVVQGVVTNQITGDFVVDIPVQINMCSNGLNFEGPMCDSSTSVFTGKQGKFAIGFTTIKGYHYKFGVAQSNQYESPSISGEGIVLKEGEINNIDLKVIPYIVLQVDIEVSKQTRKGLTLSFQTADANGNWLGGTILYDTVKQNSLVIATRYLKVLPQRYYQVTKQLCNGSWQDPQDFQFSDCELTFLPKFYVDYSDTVKIKID